MLAAGAALGRVVFLNDFRAAGPGFVIAGVIIGITGDWAGGLLMMLWGLLFFAFWMLFASRRRSRRRGSL
jgi:hypothetical protein